jgi:putative tricarboxylic transport membrane protein
MIGPAEASTRKADRIAAILFLLLAVFVIVEARALPQWDGNAPGPGFLPFWLGVLLACGAAAMLARTIAGGAARRVTEAGELLPDRATAIRLAIVVGLTSAAAVLTLIIGLVLASAVFMAATLAYLRPAHRRTNWIAALMTPVVVWLLFIRWLGVPLPAGPLGF